MKKINLNDGWRMLREGGCYPEASVPVTVCHTLKENGVIPDPYFADNEKKVQSVFEKDYTFEKTFVVTKEFFDSDEINLVFEMLDTVADVYLNDEKLLYADNMFLKYESSVKDKIVVGENVIKIDFHSPVKYLEEHKIDLGKPFGVIRKAGCMFGWDWGIRLPDSGIIGDVYLELVEKGKITDVDIRQTHEKGKVLLSVKTNCVLHDDCSFKISLKDPDGKLVFEKSRAAKTFDEFSFEIENPRLWMPRGYGEQPLYIVESVLSKNGNVLSENAKKTGLRTIRLDRSKDKERKGSKYQFIVNEIPVYFKGENLIITDADLGNVTKNTWKKLVDTAEKSNLNGIRVWGGAYYPDDVFYEECDEKGILVFQDFMFACTFYYTSEKFLQNVEKELDCQIKRLRHHPSICVFCGNNELDCIFTTMTSTDLRTVALRKLFKADKPFDFKTKFFIKALYKRLFLDLLPKKIAELSPDIDYVHSTPTSSKPLKCKSMFDYLFDGDMHYYLQYDGNAPYRYMREINCRFMAEMGFQSYPSFKTVKSFCEEKDLSPYSDVMYSHQKCANGNETIELYMKRDYVVPERFEDYVFLSQVQAGEIMKYSVEHFRRHSDYNRGMIIWQMNDCWPVVSWSGVDYYGRWKAQQYYTKRFYSDVFASVEERSDGFDLYVVSDGEKEYNGTVDWYLTDGKEVFEKGSVEFERIKNESKSILSIAFDKIDPKKDYLVTIFEENVTITLFDSPKNFAFKKPEIKLSIKENESFFEITVVSSEAAKAVMLDMKNYDGIFSDNFFDLEKDYVKKIVLKKSDTNVPDLKTLEEELFIKSLNDIILSGECYE